MSLAHDLLGLAREMAESTNPAWQQARWRRAVSTAYYALFHLLVESATARFIEDPKIRTLSGRGFSHTDMAKATTTFQSGAGGLPRHIKLVFPDPLPIEIVEISQIFVDLQPTRHLADYDQLPEFTQQEVIESVTAAERAFAAWHALQANPAARNATDLFLTSLLQIDRWKK